MSKHVSGKDFCRHFSHILSLAHRQYFNLAWSFHSHFLTDNVKKPEPNMVHKRGQGFPGACKELGQFLVTWLHVSSSTSTRAVMAKPFLPSHCPEIPLLPLRSSICQQCQDAGRTQSRCPMLCVFIQMKTFSFCFLIIEQQSGVSEKGTSKHCCCQPSFNNFFPQGQIHSLIMHNADTK